MTVGRRWVEFVIQDNWISSNLHVSGNICVTRVELVLNRADIIGGIPFFRFFPVFGMHAVCIELSVTQHEVCMLHIRIYAKPSIPCAVHMEPVSVKLYQIPCMGFFLRIGRNVDAIDSHLAE